MTKKIVMLLTLLACMLNAAADNTVSISNAFVPKGKTGNFSIDLANTDVFASSMEVHLTFPEGITFEDVTLSSRFTDNPTIGKKVSGQSVTITLLSTSNEAITGSNGLLLFITVSADANLEVGDKLTASMTKMELAKKVGNKHEKFNLDPFDFDIEITDYVVLDENSVVAPSAQTGVNVKVKRTIKANEWSTLCLPFDMTEEQVKTAFGNDVQLAEFVSYEATKEGNNVTGITITFEDTDLSEGFYGNWPYIIKTSNDITEFTLTARDIDPDEAVAEYDNGKTGGKRKVYGSFIGTYQANTVVPDNSLFISSNKYWYSTGLTKMKAFRAYFTLDDVLTDIESANARVLMSVDGNVTGIKDATRPNIDVIITQNKGYDLLGRKVENPSKGLYIMNNKKVMVK
jgi:hypothetical protein